jgi:lipopolysaccharide assembly outer membrane protein LptD (OstA)
MKSRFLSRLRVRHRGVALVLCCLVVTSSALPLHAAPGDSDDGKLTVTGDRIEYNSQSRVVRADGHVRATGRDAVITADHLEANLEAEEVTASGNVTLTQTGTTAIGPAGFPQGPKVVKGSFLSYNLRTGVGRFEKATGQLGVWTVSADTIDVTPQQDVATGASITSCDPARPLYKVTAKKIVIVPNDHFTAYDASLWVAGTRVITLPQYTSTVGRRNGPNVGYSTPDGLYLEYANSFLLGDWRDEYRIRLGTTTGLTAENLISQRFNDHVWSVDLGRSEVKDQNGDLVSLNRYSLDLVYDRQRIPGWPVDIGFEGHAGSYGELPTVGVTTTGVTTTRVEGIMTFATDRFVLAPNLFYSASGRVHYDVYGTGQQQAVIEGDTALSATLSPRVSASLTYDLVDVKGSTPFLFDSYSPGSSTSLNLNYLVGGFVQNVGASLTYGFLSMQTTVGLSMAFNISSNLAFNIYGQYNLTTQQLTEVDYGINVRCDCVTVGVVYRTFPQSPASNSFVLAVQINAFPGRNFTFAGGGVNY